MKQSVYHDQFIFTQYSQSSYLGCMVKQALRDTRHRERMRSSYTSYIGSFVDGYPYSCLSWSSRLYIAKHVSSCAVVVVLRAAAGSSGSALVFLISKILFFSKVLHRICDFLHFIFLGMKNLLIY